MHQNLLRAFLACCVNELRCFCTNDLMWITQSSRCSLSHNLWPYENYSKSTKQQTPKRRQKALIFFYFICSSLTFCYLSIFGIRFYDCDRVCLLVRIQTPQSGAKNNLGNVTIATSWTTWRWLIHMSSTKLGGILWTIITPIGCQMWANIYYFNTLDIQHGIWFCMRASVCTFCVCVSERVYFAKFPFRNKIISSTQATGGCQLELMLCVFWSPTTTRTIFWLCLYIWGVVALVRVLYLFTCRACTLHGYHFLVCVALEKFWIQIRLRACMRRVRGEMYKKSTFHLTQLDGGVGGGVLVREVKIIKLLTFKYVLKSSRYGIKGFQIIQMRNRRNSNQRDLT